ncbi:M16 family metallopeptidase [Alkalitalea saponilacus]|uniref:Predicted Zn-dependent peptidase n=1 Tax=Alkalitalea saponilacus TaxID=889453 RepID=A0A1T5BHQ6_9BACT|nr:pitrilysin family protein [Alkalitalea saponilacus]ASB49682.1 peptidase M16 [Alkalitalea saponilacus]SKB46842.1 Predicted Zn-dependent peptidase [Alkalitalea saponilacus]
MLLFSHTLPNGIRLIHHPVDSPVGHCGLIINTGSRDEKEDEHGMAHFIEHVLFKGTKKRKTYHILSRIDDVGGELNAYTTKEETCIYASFLKQDFNRAMELIHDIAFNSTFPVKEIEKEKEVIIDEINSYKDSPADLILDDFEELVFSKDAIGRNILGTPETISKFGQKDIRKFMAENYHTDQMVICSVGQIPPGKIMKIASRYFGSITPNYRQLKRQPNSPYLPQTVEKTMDTFQSHVAIGNVAYDLNHPNRLSLLLLNNILGGPGMNSRLNMSLREKNGIAYNIESIYTPYFGTGVFSIYFGTDEENLKRSIKIVHKELKKLREKKLGKLQIHNARRQLKGQITIANENREHLMLSIGKSFMLYNKVDTIEEIYNKLDNITAEKLLETANEIFAPEQLSYLIYRQS